MKFLLIAACMLVMVGLAATAGEDDRPKVGDPAPSFRLNDHEGRALSLAKVSKDAWVVLAFYPKADTPG